MNINKNVIGENAGVLWRLMSQDYQRRWELEELKNGTGFDDMELASAIGWLAREDKIHFELQNPATQNQKTFLYLTLNVYL